MKIVKFYPQDVLFFRDAKPFDAGSDNEAINAHYPLPSVFYGALRTSLIESMNDFKNGKYKDFIGTTTEHGKFRSIGPFTFNKNNIFFPMPKNISMIKNDKDLTLIKLKPFKEHDPYEIISTEKVATLTKLWHRSYETLEEPDVGYIDLNSLLEFLNGKDVITVEKDKFKTYEIENRIGIKIDKEKGAAEKRYLYRESTIRFFEGCGFASFVENDMGKLDSIKSIFLGGERHVAFTKIEDVTIPAKTLKGRIMIYLATPAIFKNGVLPQNFDGENIFINGVKCKLISIANGKSVTVSTFDIAKHKPRASKFAVPAGSVYFVESEKEIKSDGFITFTDEMEEYGFGRSLIGGWDYE
ncbi:MAG: type III-B CRISPR module-associated protein Cmr3 [Thermotogae bacterium]|nr:type III-B CRISPR module-associated protein Cmr3 [Thermotogota bacterium]